MCFENIRRNFHEDRSRKAYQIIEDMLDRGDISFSPLTAEFEKRFADIDEANHTISAESIEKFITPRTKAIVVVHVWGNPCDMDPIMVLAKKYSLKVIEDCSHAHGAMYKARRLAPSVTLAASPCRQARYWQQVRAA